MRLIAFLRSLFSPQPVRLAIVRRYCDANGNYVGELYMEGTFAGVSAYRMVGVSLDSLPLDWKESPEWTLDTSNDFLAMMPLHTVRVGAINPADNDRVRRMISDLPRRKMSLVIQNKFIEHVLETKKI
jgi:hypothetical protein